MGPEWSVCIRQSTDAFLPKVGDLFLRKEKQKKSGSDESAAISDRIVRSTGKVNQKLDSPKT